MFIRVRNFLAPPVFEDTDANFTARNLNVILLSALAGITVTILRYSALGRIWRGHTGLILLSGGLLVGLCYVLLRQRRILAGSLLTVAVLTLMPFLMMVEGDGIHDTAIMLLPVVVIVASMLFGWRGLIAYVAVIVLVFGFLVRMEIRGFLLPLSSHPVTNSDFTDALTILAVSAGMSGLLATSVRRSLQRLNHSLNEQKASEARYRAVVENQTEFIVRWTPEGTRTFVNEAYGRYFGLAVENAIGTSFFPLILDEDRQALQERVVHLLSGAESSQTYVQRVTRPDGSLGWQEWTDQVIRDETGQPIEFQSVGRDITERKQAEQALREAETMYRALVEQTTVVPYRDTVDLNGSSLYISPQIEKLIGYSAEEWMSSAEFWQKLVHPDDLPRVLAGIQQYITTGQRMIEEYRLHTKSGNWIWVRDETIVVRDDEGNPQFVHGVFIDITERKQAEDTLRLQTEQMAAFIKELETLHAVGKILVSSTDVKTLMDRVNEKIRDVFDVPMAYIALLNPHTNMIHYSYFREGGYLDAEPVPYGRGISTHVIKDRKPILINTDWERISPQYDVINTEGTPVQSWLGAPLLVGDRSIGLVVVAETRHDNAFEESDVRLLTTIASNVSIALENARLFQEVAQRADRMAALNDIGFAITSTLDLDQIFRALFEKCKDLLPLDTFYIALYDETMHMMAFPLYFKDGGYINPARRDIRENPGLSGYIINTRQTLYIPDVTTPEANEKYVMVFSNDDQAHSYLGVPMLSHGQVIGLLSIQNIQADAYSQEDIRFFETIAAQAAIAIENARLYTAAQQELAERRIAEQAAQRKMDELALLHQLSLSITSGIDLYATLQAIQTEINLLVQADAFYIAIYDEATDMVTYPIFFDQGQPYADPGRRLHDWPGLTGAVIFSGRTLYLPDMLTPDVEETYHPQGDEDWGLHTFLGIPLSVNRRVMGILSVQSKALDAYSADQIRLMESVAVQAAIAIENARLFQEVKQRADRMAALNEIGLAITSTLDLDRIFHTLFEHCKNLLPIDTFYIVLYDETTHVITFPLYFDNGTYVVSGAPNSPAPRDITENPGLSGYIIQARQTVYIPDQTTQAAKEKYKIIFPDDDQARASVGVPMFYQGRVIGLISMQNNRPAAYSQEDIRFFETITAQAAVAIENARLFRESKQRADEMTLLYQIGLALAGGENLYDALRAFVKELRRWMTVDTFYVALYDDQTNVISFPLYLTFEDDLKPSPRNLADQPGLTKEVIDLRRTLYISDIGDPLEQTRHNIVMIIKLDIRSYVGIPLMLENKIMGVMSVQSLQPKAYTNDQIRLLETLATQVVITIEKARLFESERIALAQSETLRESMAIVAGTLDESETIRQILEQLKRLVPYDKASVQLIRGDYLEVVDGQGLSSDFDLGRRFPINESEPSLPVLQGQLAYLLSEGVKPIAHSELIPPAFHVWLFVPLKVKGYIFGLIVLWGNEPGQFTEQHAHLAVTYANQVAIALENARLFQETTQRAERLATIVEIGHTVSTLQDLDSVLEIIYQQVRRIASVDVFYICLYDRENEQIAFPLTYDSGARYYELTLTLKPDTWIAQVIQTGQPFLLHRTAEELATAGLRMVGNSQRKSASILLVPLWQAGQVIGVLSIQSYSYNAYPIDLVETVAAIGDQAAIAIQNARLFTNVQQELAERKKTQLELEASNRELESLSYNIAHDMRSPVRAMVGLSQMLQYSQGDKMDEDGRSELERIHVASKRLGHLIDGFLAFLRLGRSPLNKQTLSVASLLAGLKERFTRENPGRDIQFVMDELPACEADPALLEQVWTHLIGNAVKFTRPRPQARIELGSGEKDGERYYFIRDNGIGFDMKYVDKIFVIFQHLNRQEEYEGVGVGLAIVQRVIHRHGGRIWAEAEEGIGATFYFTL